MSNDDDQQAWGLVLAFDSDNPEFTRGFEAGIIWHATEDGTGWEGLVHAGNAEMMMRIAESRGLPFRAEDVGYDWLQIAIGEPR